MTTEDVDGESLEKLYAAMRRAARALTAKAGSGLFRRFGVELLLCLRAVLGSSCFVFGSVQF